MRLDLTRLQSVQKSDILGQISFFIAWCLVVHMYFPASFIIFAYYFYFFCFTNLVEYFFL